MTVKELIEKLQSLPDECKDLEVWYQSDEEVCAEPVRSFNVQCFSSGEILMLRADCPYTRYPRCAHLTP